MTLDFAAFRAIAASPDGEPELDRGQAALAFVRDSDGVRYRGPLCNQLAQSQHTLGFAGAENLASPLKVRKRLEMVELRARALA